MKPIISILFFLLTLNSVSAQDTNAIKKNIEITTKKMAESFINRDWKEFVKYNLPSVVAALGGEEAFIKAVGDVMKDLPDSSIKLFELGKPMQLVKTTDDWQTVIEQKTNIFFSEMMVKSTTYLIGESLDGGITWTFIDSKGDLETVRVFKPDVSDKLILPERKKEIDKEYKELKKDN